MSKKATLLSRLKLDELSLVDVPANKSSRVAIFKRGKPPTGAEIAATLATVLKYSEEPGARTFSEVQEEREEETRRWKANEELYPLFSALETSLRSIAADQNLDTAGKGKLIQASCNDFMTAVKEKLPDVEEELDKALKANPALSRIINPQQEDDPMSAELQAKVTELETKLGDLTKKFNDSTASIETLTNEKTELQKKLDAANAQIDITKSDESITVGETVIKKSEVGAGVFAAMKAQQDQITKAQGEVELADLRKRAETEFGTLPGEPDAKAKVLRAVAKMSEEDRTALTEMLKAGDKAMKTLTKSTGSDTTNPTDGSAQAELDQMVEKHMTDNNVTKAVAYNAVMATAKGNDLYQKAKLEKRGQAAA